MAAHRHTQVAQEIAHMASEVLAREVRNPAANGLITVTRTDLSDDYKNVTVLISVLPHTQEEQALRFAKRARSDLRAYIKNHSRFHPLPTVDFEIDYGEKNRQRIDELTR